MMQHNFLVNFLGIKSNRKLEMTERAERFDPRRSFIEWLCIFSMIIGPVQR